MVISFDNIGEWSTLLKASALSVVANFLKCSHLMNSSSFFFYQSDTELVLLFKKKEKKRIHFKGAVNLKADKA